MYSNVYSRTPYSFMTDNKKHAITLHPSSNHASAAYALVTWAQGQSCHQQTANSFKSLVAAATSLDRSNQALMLSLMHHVQDLVSHLFGNPHSQHGWSGNEGSAQAVTETRQLTLHMCNAPLGEYECIFTSGATGAPHVHGHDKSSSCTHPHTIFVLWDVHDQPTFNKSSTCTQPHTIFVLWDLQDLASPAYSWAQPGSACLGNC